MRQEGPGRWAHTNRHYTAQVDENGLQVTLPASDAAANRQAERADATPHTLNGCVSILGQSVTFYGPPRVRREVRFGCGVVPFRRCLTVRVRLAISLKQKLTPLNLHLDSVRVGTQEIYRAKGLTPQVRDNAVRYPHTGALSEEYLALNTGMQQLFTLAAPSDSAGDLTLAVSLHIALRPELLSDRDGVRFYLPNDAQGHAAVLAYSGALARDAGGRTLYADLALDGQTLLLTLPKAWLARATYPVVIDPLIGAPALVSDPRPQQDDLARAYWILHPRHCQFYSRI